MVKICRIGIALEIAILVLSGCDLPDEPMVLTVTTPTPGMEATPVPTQTPEETIVVEETPEIFTIETSAEPGTVEYIQITAPEGVVLRECGDAGIACRAYYTTAGERILLAPGASFLIVDKTAYMVQDGRVVEIGWDACQFGGEYEPATECWQAAELAEGYWIALQDMRYHQIIAIWGVLVTRP